MFLIVLVLCPHPVYFRDGTGRAADARDLASPFQAVSPSAPPVSFPLMVTVLSPLPQLGQAGRRRTQGRAPETLAAKVRRVRSEDLM